MTLLTQDVRRLWRLASSGGDAHPLSLEWPPGANQWSGECIPTGRRFVFLSDSEERPNVYELVAPRWFEFWKRPSAVRITGNQVGIGGLAPSRDSKTGFLLGTLDQGAMEVYNPQAKQFEPFLRGLSALEFVISPDRQWMAYTEYPTGHLWRCRLDGSEPLQLTRSYAVMQQWSPDSKSLVYSDWHKLYLVSADGGEPEKLIQTGDNEVAPTWFPDGKSIAFNHYNFADEPSGIYVLDLSSRKVSMMPEAEQYYVPSFSPDGNFMVAMAHAPSRMVLYSVQTKKWRDLRRFDVPWGYWIWSSDSKSLYMALVNAQSGIYRLTIPSARWDKVSGLEGVIGARALDSFLSLTTDGRTAIMSHTGVGQIYALKWKQ